MIAIIPARGGSKGLPHKNIKKLNGKPLIAYTIEAALKSGVFEHVIVSTDSEEIATISLEYGADIPFLRPSYLATDEARSIDVYNYTIDRLKEERKICIDSVVILQPTSPLRNDIHIKEAVTLFNEKKADSVISFCAEYHPIQWHKYIDTEGKFINIFEDVLSNRQELKTSFFPNGAIYVFQTKLLNKGLFYSENSYAYIMERRYSIDIDYLEDFEYCEYLMKKNETIN